MKMLRFYLEEDERLAQVAKTTDDDQYAEVADAERYKVMRQWAACYSMLLA